MVELLKKRKFYLLAVLIFWIVVMIAKNPFDLVKGTGYDAEYGATDDATPCISSDMTIEQDFVSKKDSFRGIKLHMAASDKVNKGDFNIDIIEKDTKQVVASVSTDMSTLTYNAWNTFNFDTVYNAKGKTYTVKIYSSSVDDTNYAGIYFGDDGESLNARENGKEIAGAIHFKVTYQDLALQNVKIAVWALVIIISLLVALFLKGADEKGFLILICSFGLLITFLNPFPHAIDESTHFFRSYMISQGNLLDDTSADGVIGGEVPENYDEIVETELSLVSYIEDSENWNQQFSDAVQFYDNKYMASVTPINHMVGALGIFIGSLLHLPAIVIILLGRIFDLAFYGVCGYFALRFAKYYKNLFFCVATLPISFWLAGSYSIDPILLGSSLLFVSICLRYYFGEEEQRVSVRDMILLLLCMVSIASVKYLVYTPILLVFFLIPRRKFPKGSYVIEVILAFAIVILMAVIQLKLLGMFNFVEDRNGDVEVGRQIQYILGNIGATVSNFVNYVVSRATYYIECLGADSCFSSVLAYVGLFAVFSAPLEKNKYNFEDKKRKKIFIILCAFIVLVVYGLSMVALYAGYTPVGSSTIDGLQPRYFLPIMVFLMLILSFVKIDNKIKNYEAKVALVMQIGLMDLIAGTLIKVFA